MQGLKNLIQGHGALKTIGQLTMIGALLGIGKSVVVHCMDTPMPKRPDSVFNRKTITFLHLGNQDAVDKLLALENLLHIQTGACDDIMDVLVVCFDLLVGLEFAAEGPRKMQLSTNYDAYPVVCTIKKVTHWVKNMKCAIPSLELDMQMICTDLDKIADDIFHNVCQAVSITVMDQKFK